jgi:DNA primase
VKAEICEAKQKLPLPALMHRLGLGAHAKKSAHCPFHDDGRKSFSIYKNRKDEWRFKCFAGCSEGDEITLLEVHKRISDKEATKLFLEMAGVNGSALPTSVRLKLKRKNEDAFDWRDVAKRSRKSILNGCQNGAATPSSFAAGLKTVLLSDCIRLARRFRCTMTQASWQCITGTG